MNSAAIEAVINDYRNAYQKTSENSMEELKDNLAQKYIISGSAVVPNLETDEQWRRKVRELRSIFVARLSLEKVKLRGEE